MRVVVFAAVVILAGCGAAERDGREAPDVSTRAASIDFIGAVRP